VRGKPAKTEEGAAEDLNPAPPSKSELSVKSWLYHYPGGIRKQIRPEKTWKR